MAADRLIAGIVLASGSSRRFGTANKLVLSVDGQPIVRRVVSAYLHAQLSPILVVVGHDADAVVERLADLPVTPVHNPDYSLGQSRALVRGVEALPEQIAAAVIGVADQPFLSGAIVRRLVATFRQTGAPLVVPRYGGRRGNPVLFDRALFPELRSVTGDRGGRVVLERHKEAAIWVDIQDPSAAQDVDTVEDYRRLEPEEGGRYRAR